MFSLLQAIPDAGLLSAEANIRPVSSGSRVSTPNDPSVTTPATRAVPSSLVVDSSPVPSANTSINPSANLSVGSSSATSATAEIEVVTDT